jgi:hypothetical protein
MNKESILNQIKAEEKKNLLDNIRKEEIGKNAFYQEKIDIFKKNLENRTLSGKEIQEQAKELMPYFKAVDTSFQSAVASDLLGRVIGGGIGAVGGPAGSYYGSIAGGALGSGLHGYFATEGNKVHKLSNAIIDAGLSALPIHKVGAAFSKIPILKDFIKPMKEIIKKSPEILNKEQTLKTATKSEKSQISKGLLNKKFDETPISEKQKNEIFNNFMTDLEKNDSNLLKNKEYNADKFITAIKNNISNSETIGQLNAFNNMTLPNDNIIGKQFVTPLKIAINETIAKTLAGTPEQKIFLNELVDPKHIGKYIQSIYKDMLQKEYNKEILKNMFLGTGQVALKNSNNN